MYYLMAASRAGKGCDRRPAAITREMEDLRWRLPFAPTCDKPAILERIEELQAKKKEHKAP